MMKLVCAAALLVFLQGCKEQNKPTADEKSAPDITAHLVSEAQLNAGTLFRIDSFPSKHIVPRAVDVWVPENYASDHKHSVLYMHDGQMLFDSTTTWNQQAWKVDEWASQLMEAGETDAFIVVAIHNIPKLRWLDLYPQKALDFMPEHIRDSILGAASDAGIDIKLTGDAYLKFLVEELKPYIDKHYAVYSDSSRTFVAGSSMGGLMSMYAVSEYPYVFGGAACLSTHWPGVMPSEKNPHPEAIFKYMEHKLPEAGTHKFYFDYGDQTLDVNYPQYAPRLDDILAQKGYTDRDARNIFFEGTDHSENSWNKRLDVPLTFLLGSR